MNSIRIEKEALLLPDDRVHICHVLQGLSSYFFVVYVFISWKPNNKDKFSSSAKVMVVMKKIFKINYVNRESAA